MAKEALNALDALINSEFTMMKDLSKEDEATKEWLSTSNWALNYIASKKFRGGIPVGQITAFYGQSGTGKSMIPAIIAKDPKLTRVLVFDSEGGGTGASLFRFVGAPMEKIKYMTVQTLDSYRVNKENGKIEEVGDKEVPAGKLSTPTYEYHMGLNLILKKILYALEYSKSDEKTLIIVDSLSNMKSVRAGLLGGQDMGLTNKLLNALFSSLDNVLANTNTTLVFANKVYTDLNNTYNVEGIISGGQSVIYNPSLMIGLSTLQDNPELAEADLKSEKERRKTGLGNSLKTIRARVKKSRFGTEGRNAWVVLDATYGLTRLSGLFQLLCDFGVCIKSGTRYTIPGVIVNEKGEDVSFYKKDFPELFSKDEDKYIDLLQPIMDAKEEEIKQQRLHLNINDLDEISDKGNDEEISMFDMANAMEIDNEMSAEEID